MEIASIILGALGLVTLIPFAWVAFRERDRYVAAIFLAAGINGGLSLVGGIQRMNEGAGDVVPISLSRSRFAGTFLGAFDTNAQYQGAKVETTEGTWMIIDDFGSARIGDSVYVDGAVLCVNGRCYELQ